METHSATVVKQSTWQWDLLVGLVPLFALSPLLLYQVAELTTRDHMQFFPIALGIFVLLVLWQLRGAVLSGSKRRMWVAVSLLILSAMVYGYGVWAFSPWFAHLALLLVFTAWALGRFGNKHWGGVAGLTCLLASTLPLPWGWDQGFSNWLQTSAAWCSSKALDALGIPCLQNGGLVETRDMQLVADEVCGGLASVYAFAAFSIVISILQHTSFLVGLKTLVLVPLWTLFGNFLRLFGIVVVKEYWERDLSNGMDFRILEISTAVLILLLIWSTSRFLRRLFDPIPVSDAEFGPVFSGLNKLFCWPQPDPFEELEPQDEYERQRFRKRREELLANRQRNTDFRWSKNAAATWSVRATTAILLVCAALPIGSLAKQGINQLNFGRPQISPSQAEGLGNKDSLPAELEGGWKQRGFQFLQRNPRSRQGEFSLLWRYGLEERVFDVSIDLPFVGWNNPASPLELQGWKVEQSTVHWQDNWPWIESRLENQLGGKAIMFHSLFTRSGEPFANVPPQVSGDEEEQSAENDAAPLDSAAYQATSTAITYQFQLFSESGIDLSDADRQALLDQFLNLRTKAQQLVK